MRTEPRPQPLLPRRIVLVALVAAAVVAIAAPAPVPAEVRVDSDTEIGAVRFVFTDSQSLREGDLRKELDFTIKVEPSGLERAFAFLPGVSGKKRYALLPLEIARGAARVRRHYREQGFPRAEVRYEITPAGRENTYVVTYLVSEGPPLLVESAELVDAHTGGRFEPPPADREDFEERRAHLATLAGERWTKARGAGLERRITTWLRNRGYPYPETTVDTVIDSVASTARVQVRVAPGAYRVVGDVTIEGHRALSEETIRRELPFKPGDPFSARMLAEGGREVESLDIVRLAMVDAGARAAGDSAGGRPESSDATGNAGAAALESSVPVTVRVNERDPRLISADVGYTSDGGIAGEARWTHRNFTGGARTLTVSGAAQTGSLALVDDPDVRYRGSATLKQPYLFDRRLSLLVGPYVEYRNDSHDRSYEIGGNWTLIYELAPLRSLSFQHDLGRRHVLEYRLEDLSAGRIDLLTFLELAAEGVLDSLGADLDHSHFTLAATLGQLDDPANPHRGYVIRPSVRVTAPGGWNSNEYTRLDAKVVGFRPIGSRVVTRVRLSAGTVLPFGKSLPAPDEDPGVKFLQLRDIAFTAGGADDVRGWANRLLGPKFPDIRFNQEGDSLVASADDYVPLGGLNRVSASIELGLPFPHLGDKWGTHVFLDAGRVWTDDERLQPGEDQFDQERIFVSTGMGIDYRTIIGSVRVGVGYKLNPSLLDEADPEDILAALAEERPLSTIERHADHRFQIHLAIGSQF
jgi:outer membrane protein assembly factor BamA